MNTIKITLMGAIAVTGAAMVSVAPAQGATFNFSCDPAISAVDCSGEESGSLDFSSLGGNTTSGYTYEIKIDNTSTNNADITGFGFVFDKEFAITNWSLTAYTDTDPSGTDWTNYWTIDGNSSVKGSSYDGTPLKTLNFNFVAEDGTGNDKDAAGNPIDDDIKNWNLSSFDGILTFTSDTELTALSSLLRLQTTGANGEGSLKLLCTDTGSCETTDVPEPLTVMGSLAALGFAGTLRKKQRQNQLAKEAIEA